MTPFEPIYTDRLILRPPRLTDAADLFRLASSAAVTRYLAWPRHTSVEDTFKFFSFAESEWKRWPVGPLLIVSRVDGLLQGASGLTFETEYRASTGYFLAEAVWGKGLASEALRAVGALAERLGVRRLYAHCHTEHAASARVLEHVGFEREGILRRFLVFPNLTRADPQDVFCYSRLS